MKQKTIYTRRGDEGMTCLAHAERVPKDDIRIETSGQLDELNALLGLVIAHYPQPTPDTDILRRTQRLISHIMAFVSGFTRHGTEFSLEEETRRLERATDQAMEGIPFRFLQPGTNALEALLHLARAKTRTCERRLVTLSSRYALPPGATAYINRLSDYLYALAVKNT